jgi:hypothetical protein
MALRVRLDAIMTLREAIPPANFWRCRRCVTRRGAASGVAVASLAEAEAFHIARSAPSVGPAASGALAEAVVATAGTLGAPVTFALAMAGNAADRMQTKNPVRMERRKKGSFFHTYGVS